MYTMTPLSDGAGDCLFEVEVEFKYEAEQADELSINVGDIIKNVVMSEGGWWEGELNGKKGMFPDNFVKVIKKEEKVEPKEPKTVQASKRQSVRDLANKLKDQVHEGPAPARKRVKKRAKVLYSYEPENDDEIKLEVDDVVDVLKQEEEGWWEGIVNGRQGMFPSNFVEVFEEDGGSDEKEEQKDSDTNIIKPKKVMGVGLGNIFEGGQIKLRPAGGSGPKKPVAAEKDKKPDKPPEEPMIRKPRASRGSSVEDSLLPISPEDGYSFPDPVYNGRDRYEFIHIRDIGVQEAGERFQIEPDLSKSGLGSEIQTESESDASSAELIEVGNRESVTDYGRRDVYSNVEAPMKPFYDGCLNQRQSDIKFKAGGSVMNKLSLAQELKMAENVMVEDDLIEFENVNVHPDFDEGISVSPGDSDIDQNNQNTRFADTFKNPLENKNQNEFSDMNNDLKYILDDLDSHLNLSDSFAKEVGHSGNEVSHDRSYGPTCQTDYVIDTDSVSHRSLSKSGPPTLLSKSGPPTLPKPSFLRPAPKPFAPLGPIPPSNQLRLIGEHKTPPYEGEFSHAVDSIYVTRKRTLHSAEKQSEVVPKATPLRPPTYGEEREQTDTVDDNKRKTSRKSVTFSPVNKTSGSKPDGNLPKYGLSSLSSATPRTYFATLEKSGHLSPFIKSIAKKYGLFNTPASPNQESQEESFDENNDLELDVSYASILLGKSSDFDDSVHNIDSFISFENQKADIETGLSGESYPQLEKMSDTAQCMINDYLYDVLQSTGGKPPGADQETEMMDSYIDQFVDDIISRSYAAVDIPAFDEKETTNKGNVSTTVTKSAQSDAEDHDSELSDLEFYSDSVLLCITQGQDDSPPLSSCSPSLYPLRVTPEAPHSPVKKSESAIITGSEKDCHWFSRNQIMSQDDQLFKPVVKPQMSKVYHWDRTANDDNNNILGYMMSTSATEPKLPSSRSACQTSSYCRIPFGSGEAPSFWFKKDFKESPKEKKVKKKIEIKVKSPGKRSFTSFCETSGKEILHQVPSLAKLAQKVHQEYFRQKLDAIGRRFNNELKDYSTCQSCVESSPAKKRRRKQERNYRYRFNVNNSSLSPVEEGSVEVYFTSLLDHTPGHEGHTILKEHKSTSDNVERIEDAAAKVDWSRTLFGSKSDTDSEKAPTSLHFHPSERGFKPFVRHSVSTQCQSEGSPFVSPFKKDRHIRQRPVECMASDPFVDELSEKRQNRNIWPKIRQNEEEDKQVVLTGYRRLNSRGEEALGLKSDELEELERSYGKRTACNHAHTCSQRLISPGNFHISQSELDDEPAPLSDLAEARQDHLVDDSYTHGIVSHRDVSTMTNFSDNDLCNTSDFSENLSYEANFGSRSDRSHSFQGRDLDISASTISDEGHSFSMFYKPDAADVDSRDSEVNKSDAGTPYRESFGNHSELNHSDVYAGTPNKRGESLTLETCADGQWDTVSTDSAVIVEKIDTLEQVVESHLNTSSETESNVLELMKTRKDMYEAISEIMDTCATAMDYSKGVTEKIIEGRECIDEGPCEFDDLVEDAKNVWDISPDPDALLKDFEEIDLTDTPQYVAGDGNDEEIKQFLDDVLQPFDDIMADSFTSMSFSKESPIHRTSTKNTDLQQKSGLLDLSSRDSTIAGSQTNEESVLNRSFLEDQSGNTSFGTPLKFGHENASSTPIDEPCSPACVQNLGFEINGEMNKVSDDDESFLSARSSRTNQYDYSKNTAESFDSYRTGIDRSSILGWTDDDTLNANSDLEGFLQTITENSAERTGFSQNEQPGEEDPLNRYRKDKGQFDWSNETNEERNKENGGGDYLIDLDSIHIDLHSAHDRVEENLADDNGFTGNVNTNSGLGRESNALPATAGDNLQDKDDVLEKGLPVQGEIDTFPPKPACFYVGSSDESVHSPTGTEV